MDPVDRIGEVDRGGAGGRQQLAGAGGSGGDVGASGRGVDSGEGHAESTCDTESRCAT